MTTANPPRRVVITGVGLISPLGDTPADYATALAEGRSGVRRLEPPAGAGASMAIAGLADRFAGGIEDFGDLPKEARKAIRKGLKVMCRETQMAVASAQLALADAGLGGGPAASPERAGVVLGSDYMLTLPEDYTHGVLKCADGGSGFDYRRWGDEGLGEMQPLWMLKYLPNMPASHIAIYNDFRGPNNSLTMREASGLMAIGEAFRVIARGRADQMVAGATGTRVLPMQAIHAMQTEPLAEAGADPGAASRPFDRGRTGMVAGEGAGMVILESLDTATARGARVYGELLGFGSSQCVARGGVSPGEGGGRLRGKSSVALANAMTAALRDAGTAAPDIGHLNAHGLATPEGDAAEAEAIAAVFGGADHQPPVIAPKANFGNLGAGGGVVELIASLLACDGSSALGGELPRLLNYADPDPEAPINAAGSGVPAGDRFLAANTTPQGQAAALCVGRLG